MQQLSVTASVEWNKLPEERRNWYKKRSEQQAKQTHSENLMKWFHKSDIDDNEPPSKNVQDNNNF